MFDIYKGKPTALRDYNNPHLPISLRGITLILNGNHDHLVLWYLIDCSD